MLPPPSSGFETTNLHVGLRVCDWSTQPMNAYSWVNVTWFAHYVLGLLYGERESLMRLPYCILS